MKQSDLIKSVKVKSLAMDLERAVPDIIWGGAEGEAQKRRSNKDELLDAEKRQTGVLIK